MPYLARLAAEVTSEGTPSRRRCRPPSDVQAACIPPEPYGTGPDEGLGHCCASMNLHTDSCEDIGTMNVGLNKPSVAGILGLVTP